MGTGLSSTSCTWRMTLPRSSADRSTCANERRSKRAETHIAEDQFFPARWPLSSRDLALLKDMLDAARTAVLYVRGVTQEQFVLNTEKQDAVIYRVGVIGEAARNVSEETRTALTLRWL